jgi:general secretion pathway protein G
MARMSRRSAFTLVEILIVVVILAILAAAVIPQFTDSTSDAKDSTASFNLSALRSQIALYKAQHSGTLPSTTTEAAFVTQMTTATTAAGAAGGTFGPYLQSIPANPKCTDTTKQATITVLAADAAAGDVTTTTAGWLYNKTNGKIWRADDITK